MFQNYLILCVNKITKNRHGNCLESADFNSSRRAILRAHLITLKYTMSTTMIIALVLLTFVVTGQSSLPAKTLDAQYLDDIYDGCQVTTFDKFCLGGEGSTKAYPEGTDCLERRNCQALVTGHQTGSTIEWVLLVVLYSEVESVTFDLESSKGAVRVAMYRDDDEVEVSVSDKISNQTIVSDSAKDIGVFKLVETLVINTSPPMLMARLTSPTVIRYDPISIKVDTTQPVDIDLVIFTETDANLYSFEDVSIFDRKVLEDQPRRRPKLTRPPRGRKPRPMKPRHRPRRSSSLALP